MTPSALARQLERIARDADRAADTLAEQVMRENVRPYCDKTGLAFMAGMGAWAFYKGTEPVYPCDLPKRLQALLWQPWPTNPNNNSIGSMLPDYTP